MCLTGTKFVPGNPKHQNKCVWSITDAMKFIGYNNGQWPNPGLLSFRQLL